MCRLLPSLLCCFLAACGLTDTTSTAATAAKLKAEEIRQGKATAEKLQQQLETNMKQGEQRLQAAEEKN